MIVLLQFPFKDLRGLLDTIESHVRSLEIQGVNKEHFGALLIPLIQEKLQMDIRLEIRRHAGKGSWKTEHYLECLKDEIDARDNCAVETMDVRKTDFSEIDVYQPCTIQTLVTHIGNEMKKKGCGYIYQQNRANMNIIVTNVLSSRTSTKG